MSSSHLGDVRARSCVLLLVVPLVAPLRGAALYRTGVALQATTAACLNGLKSPSFPHVCHCLSPKGAASGPSLTCSVVPAAPSRC